jgi:hypothetical protein
MDEPTMAFVVERHDAPAVEVRVNFGVFAGRAATAAEIDRLAEWLLDEVGAVSIVSEDRHEFDARGEASLHQVRIELDDAADDATTRRILERAEHWARLCVADRHAEVTDGV